MDACMLEGDVWMPVRCCVAYSPHATTAVGRKTPLFFLCLSVSSLSSDSHTQTHTHKHRHTQSESVCVTVCVVPLVLSETAE